MITPSLFLQQYQRSLNSWQWRKNRSPLPRLEHDCDEESMETLAAPRDGAAPPQAARGPARPLAPAGPSMEHTQTNAA